MDKADDTFHNPRDGKAKSYCDNLCDYFDD